MEYKYFAPADEFDGMTAREVEYEIEPFDLEVEQWVNGECVGTVTVSVYAPEGYELTPKDHEALGELVVSD